MADNFGVKLGVEGEKEFKRAISDINQQFKVLGSEMKLAASQFDKNEKSIASLTARNEVLARQIDAQRGKVEILRSALANATESFGENDRRTRQWAAALNNAEAELNDLTRELKSGEAAIDKMGDEMGDAADKADDMADEVEDAAEAAEESGRRFEKLGGVLKGVGATMGTLVLAAGTVAVKLGKEVIDAFGELEQNLGGSEAVFGEHAKKLQTISEDAYKNMGTSQSEYLATANKMGALFQGSGIEQERSLDLTTQAMQRAADMASVMGIDTSAAMEAVTGAAKGNFTMMDNLGVAMNATTLEAYAVSKGMDKAFSSMTNAEKAELAMEYFFTQTEQYAGNFARESTQTISGSFGLLSAAAESWVAGLGNSEADMTKLTGNMVDAFQSVVENVVPVIENIVASLPTVLKSVIGAIGQLLPTLLETVASLFEQVLQTLISLLPELIPAAVQAIMTIINALVENLPLIMEAAIQIIIALVQGIAEALPELVPAIIDALILVCETLINNLDMILDAAFQLVMGLAQGIINAIPILVENLPQLITSIIEFLTGHLPEFIQMGIQLIVTLIGGIISAIPDLVAALPQIVTAIIEGLGAALGMVGEIGINIVKGLWDGIASMGSWLWDQVSGFFGGIVDGVCDFLGIHSPSTVFAGIGENMSAGIGVGFTNAMKDVEKDINSSIPTDFDLEANAHVSGALVDVGPQQSKTIVEHTGIIRVEGVDSENALTGVVDIVVERLRQEVRV